MPRKTSIDEVTPLLGFTLQKSVTNAKDIEDTGIPRQIKPKNMSKEDPISKSDDIEMACQQQKKSRFKNFLSKFFIILPYLWPKNNYLLQLRVFFCFLLMVIGRVVNVYVPICYKWIVDSLTYPAKSSNDEVENVLKFRCHLILIYCALRFFQGAGISGGALNNLRSFLWIRVQQYTTREVQVALYSHLHSLSLRWHISRKTGEVLAIMDRGTNSVNQLLMYVIFQILPTIVDVIVAVVYFFTSFNQWFGLIVLITMVAYIVFTVIIIEWAIKFRRQMNHRDNEARAKGVDSLINFETVKYYNAEEYEVNRYRRAVLQFQNAEWRSLATLTLLGSGQNIVINCGFLVGTILCAYFVVDHVNNFTVGNFVLFITYLMQLYTPLNFLGTYYRIIQQSLTDIENMIDLLNEKQEVVDAIEAKDLKVSNGKIEFRNVNFHYFPGKPILNNVSFTVEPGSTVALVGPSGSGKSTIIRLLFRFYDIQSGQILFDEQNIADIKQRSLRQRIGVVPQDGVLFNDNIRYNIRYSKVDASDEDVAEAADAAEIHSKILSFPDGYETVVGERGMKLSGGEQQRVSIARTILKGADFILLDEATSALDTRTERNIQVSLNEICQGKTTVIVAHRLSTIVNADEILVLQDGSIVERGKHKVLIEKGEVYADMWEQQLASSETESIDEELEDEFEDTLINQCHRKFTVNSFAAKPAKFSAPSSIGQPSRKFSTSSSFDESESFEAEGPPVRKFTVSSVVQDASEIEEQVRRARRDEETDIMSESEQ